MRVLAIVVVLSLVCGREACAQADAPGELLLEVWINGNTQHELARTSLRNGVLFANCADLAAAGIRISAKRQECALTDMLGIKANIETHDQRLVITATNDNLLPQVVSVRPTTVEIASEKQSPATASGMILAYDTSLESTDLSRPGRSATGGVALNLSAFQPWGAFRTDGFANVSATGSRLVRLNTAFTAEDPGRLHVFTIGDTITGDLEWSRSVRIAGFQIASNFALQPDLITQPMPQFFGASAVPSTLDVLVNGIKVFEGKVDPGPFQVRDLPALTGASQVTLITTDVLGRQGVQTLSLYATEASLAPGLTEYTADAGLLRKNFGLDSFSYGDLVATGTVRHGTTDWLTLDGHGEIGANIAQGGAGAVVTLAPYGKVSLALAGSHSRSGSGAMVDTGFEMSAKPFSLFGELSATAGAYRDIATLSGPPTPKLRTQLGANVAFGRYGSLSTSWIDIQYEHQRTKLVTAAYSLSFGSGYTFNLVGFHDMDAHASGAEIFLSIPLGGSRQGEASARFGQGRPQSEVAVSQQASPDGGFGYRVSANTGTNNGAEGSAIWNGPALSANAAVSVNDGRAAARVGASGSLIVMGDDVYAARRIDGVVALVDAGQADVRVYHENRQVAVTGKDGTALITGLVPYGRNTVGVSAEDYPMDVLMSSPDRVVVPNRFGAVINLAPSRGAPLLIALLLPDGKVPPLGTHVELDDHADALVVGARGRIFIHHLPAPVRGHLVLSDGRCSFLAIPPATRTNDHIPEVGPLTCIREAGGQ